MNRRSPPTDSKRPGMASVQSLNALNSWGFPPSSWPQCASARRRSRLSRNLRRAARFWTAVIPTRRDEVTALAWAALQTPQLATDTATRTQSGDSEASVAAVQDARAPTRFALGSWPQCASELWWSKPSTSRCHLNQEPRGRARASAAAFRPSAHLLNAAADSRRRPRGTVGLVRTFRFTSGSPVLSFRP